MPGTIVLGMSNEVTRGDDQAQRDSILEVPSVLEVVPVLAGVHDRVDLTFLQELELTAIR